MRYIATFGMLWILASMPTVTAQEKVKLSSAELRQLLDTYHVMAGTNDANGCAFMIVNRAADKREQYVECPNFDSGVRRGTARIDGDKLCTTYADTGTESCSEWHRVGDGRYELQGGRVKLYRLK